jgi:hypothetical protein
MTQRYALAADQATVRPGCDCPASGKVLHPIDALMRVCRAIWPSKTALELAARTGASERTAKYWLARQCDLSAEHLAELLRSDAGLEVLEALMGEARPAWWSAFRRQAKRAVIRRQLKELQNRLDEVDGED